MYRHRVLWNIIVMFFLIFFQSFCLLNPLLVGALEFIFKRCVTVIHICDPNTLINLAKFFAQLLSSDVISWKIFSAVRLTEIERTYCGRIYLKEIFNELMSLMGHDSLKKRILDPWVFNLFLRKYLSSIYSLKIKFIF